MEISNYNGDLANNYPSRILIPEAETSLFPSSTIYEHAIDATRLRELCQQARAARCRTRFPVPVIIYRGNYICRSATLSGYSEMVGRYYSNEACNQIYSMFTNAPVNNGENVAVNNGRLPNNDELNEGYYFCSISIDSH